MENRFLIVGLVLSGLVHGALLGGLLVASVMDPESAEAEDVEEEDTSFQVIQAELIAFGRAPDPTRLPDRIVPVQATAPETGIAISKRPRKNANMRPREEPPPEHAEDDMESVLAAAAAFAERVPEREREGDPNGQEGVTMNRAGNRYAGRISGFVRRGWTVPMTMDTETLSTLVCRVHIVINANLRISRLEIAQGSGNAMFDQSVRAQIARILAQGQPVPAMNPEDEPTWIGPTNTIRFHGRNVRR